MGLGVGWRNGGGEEMGFGSREDGWEGEGRGVRDYNGVR